MSTENKPENPTAKDKGPSPLSPADRVTAMGVLATAIGERRAFILVSEHPDGCHTFISDADLTFIVSAVREVFECSPDARLAYEHIHASTADDEGVLQ